MSSPEGDRRWMMRLVIIRDVILVVIGAGVILLALWWALGRIGNVVLVLIMAVMFEITLSPLVDRLAAAWGRRWAVLVVVAGAVVVFVVGGILLVTTITSQVIGLVSRLPADFNPLAHRTPAFLSGLNHLGMTISFSQIESRVFASAGQVSSFLVTQTVNLVTRLVDGVVDGAITLFITVYLLLDAERIQAAIVRLVPDQHKEGLLTVEHTLARVIGGYVRGQVVLSLIVGTAFGVGTWLIGLPYPLVLGLVAAIMEFIPLLGPVLGAILPLVMAAFSHPLVEVPEVLVLLGAVHLLESQILAPRIIRSQMGLHPVLSVVALMIGAELKGIWGAVFAVPVAGILVAAWVAGVRVWRDKVVLPSQRPPGPDVAAGRRLEARE